MKEFLTRGSHSRASRFLGLALMLVGLALVGAVCPEEDDDKNKSKTVLVDHDWDGAVEAVDCDDDNPNVWNLCDTCVDEDGDSYFKGCDEYITVGGEDCNDDPLIPGSGLHWFDCTTCVDLDIDGAGMGGCDLGDDCNDSDDSCVTGCNTWYEDADADTFGDPATFTAAGACKPAGNWVTDGTDCDVSSATASSHWSDCYIPAQNVRVPYELNSVTGDGISQDFTVTLSQTPVLDPNPGPPKKSIEGYSQDYYKITDYTILDAAAGSVSIHLEGVPGDGKRLFISYWVPQTCYDDLDGDGHPPIDGCDIIGDCDDLPDTGSTCFANCAQFIVDFDNDGWGNDDPYTRYACVNPYGYVPLFCKGDKSNCDDADPSSNPATNSNCVKEASADADTCPVLWP